MPKDPSVGFAFKRSNKAARDWAQKHAGETINSITDNLRDAIKGIIADAFEEGIDGSAVAQELANYLDDPAQAELIARTETMRAANAGVQEAWNQAVDEGLLTGQEKQ